MLMTPAGMAIATMTVMLWILWSDTLRAKKPSAILYTVRIALYLVVSGIFILNMIRYPAYFAGSVSMIDGEASVDPSSTTINCLEQ